VAKIGRELASGGLLKVKRVQKWVKILKNGRLAPFLRETGAGGQSQLEK
jgi:hypothetical protein